MCVKTVINMKLKKINHTINAIKDGRHFEHLLFDLTYV